MDYTELIGKYNPIITNQNIPEEYYQDTTSDDNEYHHINWIVDELFNNPVMTSIDSSIIAEEMTIKELAQVLDNYNLKSMLEVLDIFLNIVELDNCNVKIPLEYNIQLFNKLNGN